MIRAALTLGVLLAATLPASADTAAEVAFWQSVWRGDRPAEYQAYLDTFPHGQFAALARLRLRATLVAPALTPVPALASVRPARPAFRLVDGVTLDVDARGLHQSSNLRVVVVPPGTPDAIADVRAFTENSVPVEPTRTRLSLPAAGPGPNELRLYHIPYTATTFRLAARAPVLVEAGVVGAALVRDLVREAAELGPLRFEANHRDRPMLVQAAFLRLEPRTEWRTQWFAGQPVGDVSRQTVVVGIGQPNVAPDFFGSRGEALCVLPVADAGLLDRLAGMRVGDPVLVSGVPTAWGSDQPGAPVLLDRCVLR